VATVQMVEQRTVYPATNRVNCAPEEGSLDMPAHVTFEHLELEGEISISFFEPVVEPGK
jgi:hypothetical protein